MALRITAVLPFLAWALFHFNVDAAVVTATPVQRVISLLGKLEAQITEEGKKEAAEYDKFACWCKEQADNTQFAIEKSEKIIKALKAKIEKLTGEIKVLEGEIKDLEKTIEEKEKAIEKAVEKREKEHEEYVKEAEEVADAITAIDEAIKVLKESKKDMKKAKLDLLQGKLLEVLSLSSTPPSESRIQAVQSLAQQAQTQPKHAYEYQSNDIIGTLMKLQDEFKADKKKLNIDEKNKIFAFEENKQSLENEKAFAEKDKIEKTTLKTEKEEEKGKLEKEETEESEALKADESFMSDLETDCQEKAEQWDQRSKKRSEELTAIGKAIEHLEGGVKENYGSNRLAASASSFLQLGRGSSSVSTVLARVATVVSAEAKRLKSASLMGLAVKLSMGGHFDSVVKLVEDLIKKLEDEQKLAEQGKTKCDEEMTKAVASRDDNKLEMDKQEATIALKQAEKVKLSGEVKKLNAEVADLKKAMLEATELRNEEKANNERTLQEAEEGKKAVEDAIEVLQEFYGSFLQGPDRHGTTIEDAPKLTYEGDYEGKTDASKGIIGILNVIADDFQKTIDDTKTAEETAASEYETFEKDTNGAIDEKDKLIDTKEDDIKKATDAITEAKDAYKDAEDLMNNAMEELEKVTAMCMTGEGTFEERKKQREEEIKALKGAMKILQDWKDF